ncbi:hypothetical protein Fmac_004331 [Flemingia macrophylla]|uniref:Late embryogenesis abundant protein LEA-2 subgroup domain-containing protein n=1 Tax=Flemingia macrophylla TaxID=520843 RepID=A0ABD1N4L7_9FABA
MEEQAQPTNAVVVAAADPPPARRVHDTYIVQFPKDQVYRVPPRENALIVEQHRNPPAAVNKHRRCCCFCSLRLFITVALVVVAVVAVLCITLATLYFIFNPRGPVFKVSHVAVKESNTTSRSRYEVSLTATNVNRKLGVAYEHGDVSLLFEGAKVATGSFPVLAQRRQDSTEVKLHLVRSNGPQPNHDRAVELKLEMQLGLRVIAAGLKTWLMRSNVVCDFKVSGPRNDTRVLSQHCNDKFNQY